VSSRAAEKQRLRAERLEAERRAAAKRRRTRRLRLAGTGVAVLVAVGAGAAAVALNGAGDDPGGQAGLAPGEITGAFGQHYAGLDARRDAAGVTTMMDTMSSQVHLHPQLTILANGKPLSVPANIGIDPRQDGMQMASLHTHEEPGVIHVEGMEPATLGQFFAVWGVSLSADRLGPYRQPVRMWVDGERSRAFGTLSLAHKQRVILAVGRGGPKP
jgi:hypothetical protein